METKNRKLKNYFIYPKVLAKVIFCFVITSLNVFTIKSFDYNEWAGTWVYWVFVVVLMGVAAGLGIWYTHKLTGPMMAFKRTCEAVTRGELDRRVKLRPDDEFTDVAEAINAMLDSVTKTKA